jgi:hypothetical protein
MATAEVTSLLTADEWEAVRHHWERREVNVPLRAAVGAVEGVRLDALDRLLDTTQPRLDQDLVVETLEESLLAASRVAHMAVLLALYVHSECLRAWEESDAYGMIRQVVSGLGEAVRRLAGRDHEQRLLTWCADYAQGVIEAMAVESGLNCSCPVEMRRRSAAAVRAARRALSARPPVPPALKPAVDLLRSDARVSREYFTLVEQVADAVCQLDETGSPAAVRAVVEKLESAERSTKLGVDVYRSELRAHRRGLERLSESVASPRLHLTSATIVYCYPFALEMDPEEAVREVHERYGVRRVRRTALTDAWQGDDPRGRTYSGVTLFLSPLEVTPTYEDARFTATAEVRLSRLGNHYVRIEASLDDKDLHATNQALRRASRNMGEETIAADGLTWPRLTDYASHAIRELRATLGTDAVESVERSFQTVIVLRLLEVVEASGERRPATLDDLTSAVGATLLLNPVIRPAIALEEWLLAPAPIANEVDNILSEDGLAGEVAIRTPHSTLLWLPDAPDFLRLDFEQMAEFAASLPGVLHHWQHKLAREAGDLARAMEEMRRGGGRDPAASLIELHVRELRLRMLESDVEELLAFLHSPNLVRTQSYRRFLDALYAASELDDIEKDLKAQLVVLGNQYGRVSAITSVLERQQSQEIAERARQREKEEAEARAQAEEAERRRDDEAARVRRRAEDWLAAAAALIAVSSLAELFGWLNWPKEWEYGLFVLALVAIAVLALRFLRVRDTGDSPPGSAP